MSSYCVGDEQYRARRWNGGIVAVGAFADPSFPAPRISVYEERRHGWADIPALDVEHID